MRSIVCIIVAVAAALALVVNHMLSSSDTGDSMREGQSISLADAGTYNSDTFTEVSDWLSELD